MAEWEIQYDFSAVENIRFECLSQCGRCCFYQAPTLTTSEINRIRKLLEEKTAEEYDAFVLDWITFLGRLFQIDKEMIEQYKESLKWFWSPLIFDEAEDCILVRTYTVHSMPSTGRCKFLNPIDMTCFIYPARPATCRAYPFTITGEEKDVFKVIVAMENCPGLGRGQPLDKKMFIEAHQRHMEEIRRDTEVYMKYILEKGIKIVKKEKRKLKPRDINEMIREWEKAWREQYFFGIKRGESVFKKGKKIIEPFAELGIIPPHPLIQAWNKWLEEKRHH